MTSLAVVPAAGRGQRFGGAKLLALVHGEPLLDRTIASLLDGGVARVVVVLPPATDFSAVRRLADPRVQTVINPDPSRGMLSSIQAALRAADGDPILILPGDMPFVRPATVAAVLEAGRQSGRIVAPTRAGRHGHPVALPGELRAAVLAVDVAHSLKDVIAAAPAGRIEIPVTDDGVLRDVDVAADLQDRALDGTKTQ
jgi:molybdenum cofactor cytidylyltransferase